MYVNVFFIHVGLPQWILGLVNVKRKGGHGGWRPNLCQAFAPSLQLYRLLPHEGSVIYKSEPGRRCVRASLIARALRTRVPFPPLCVFNSKRSCYFGFLPKSKNMKVRVNGDCKLPIGVDVCVCACVNVVVTKVALWLAGDLTRVSPCLYPMTASRGSSWPTGPLAQEQEGMGNWSMDSWAARKKVKLLLIFILENIIS